MNTARHEEDLVASKHSRAIILFEIQGWEFFPIGCQLVTPCVLLDAVDPGFEAVLGAPLGADDHDFLLGKGDQR